MVVPAVSVWEQGTLLTVEEVIADLEATIFMALQQRHSDDDSVVYVPIWELKMLIEAARAS